MPHSISAKKRVRQNKKRRLANRKRKSHIRTWVGKTTEAIEEGRIEDAEIAFRKATKALDKAVKANILHKNTVARRKSKLARALNEARSS